MKKRLMAAAAAALALVMAVPSPVLAGEPSDDISYMGSTDATEVNVGMIMGPPSMGMGWMIHENEEGNTYNDYNFEVGGVDYTALASKLNTGDYDIIHCPSNVGAILYNNKDLKEEVEVIDISNLGLLYILTTDDSIKSMDDLKGRTVYSIGEGGPPEYTFGLLPILKIKQENTHGRIHETTTDKCSEAGKEQGQIDPDHPVLAGSLGDCRPGDRQPYHLIRSGPHHCIAGTAGTAGGLLADLRGFFSSHCSRVYPVIYSRVSACTGLPQIKTDP